MRAFRLHHEEVRRFAALVYRPPERRQSVLVARRGGLSTVAEGRGAGGVCASAAGGISSAMARSSTSQEKSGDGANCRENRECSSDFCLGNFGGLTLGICLPQIPVPPLPEIPAGAAGADGPAAAAAARAKEDVKAVSEENMKRVKLNKEKHN